MACIWNFLSPVLECCETCWLPKGATDGMSSADAEDGNRGALPPAVYHEFEPGHKIYPYLLRGMEITRQTRSGRLTSLTSRWRAFMYLAVVLDWVTRRVLSRRVSIAIELHSASRHWRTLSPATASWTSSIPTGARISRAPRLAACSPVMASPSAWPSAPGVFVGRLRRGVKYEGVYLVVR